MNTFTLKFFAKLREDLAIDELQVPCSEVTKLSQLTAYLLDKYPSWGEFLDGKLMCAVNQEMVVGDHVIKRGDEVALFPPVTGG